MERPSGVMDVIPRSPGAAPEAFTSAVGSRTRAPGRTRPDSRLHCHRRDQPCPSSTAYTIVPDRGTDDAGAGSVPWPRTNQVADATTTSPVMTSASTRRRRSSCSSGAPGIGVEGTTSSGGGAILVETDGDRRGTPAWAGRNKVAPQLGQADPLVDPDQSQRRHSLGRSRAGLMGSPGAGRTAWPRSPRRRPAGSRRRVRHRAAPDPASRSSSGSSTNARWVMRGCGTVRVGSSIRRSSNSSTSMSTVRGPQRTSRTRSERRFDPVARGEQVERSQVGVDPDHDVEEVRLVGPPTGSVSHTREQASTRRPGSAARRSTALLQGGEAIAQVRAEPEVGDLAHGLTPPRSPPRRPRRSPAASPRWACAPRRSRA